MFIGSLRRRRLISDGLGEDAIEMASPFPFTLDVEASPVITDIELLRK